MTPEHRPKPETQDFGPPGGSELSQLSEATAPLSKELRRFDPIQTAIRVAALLTEPRLQANTIRLEALLHLALIHCGGGAKPKPRHLTRWLNVLLQPLSFEEDPPEDVFVSNVCDGAGNYRIFPGVWNSADFCLQQTLDVISSLPDDPEVRELSKTIRALLRVSDAVADRRNLSRFLAGEGTSEIRLYSDDWLGKLTRALIFRPRDLDDLEIDQSTLEPFLLDSTNRSVILSENFGNTSVERHPLASRGGVIYVLLPTAFSLTVRRYVLDWLEARGLLDAFTRNLARREARQALQEGMSELGTTPHPRPVKAVQEGTPGMLTSAVATFDIGKYAHVVVVHEDARDVYETGLSTDRTMSTEEKRKIEEHIAAVAEELSAEPNYSGGLTFVLFGGLGRGHFLSFPRLAPHWHVTGCGLSDFLLMSHDSDVSCRRLWKLEEQEGTLSEMGAAL